MTSLTASKYQQLNVFVLSIIILFVLTVQNYITNKPIINPIADIFLGLFASIGFYRILISCLHIFVSTNQLLLKLYWGRNYLHGLWCYTYDVKNKPDVKKLGIWRIEQDLFGTKIIGFGLDDKYEVRTRLVSMTQLINNNGVFEVSNLKSEATNPESDHYSRTSMSFDLHPKKSIFSYPTKIRAITTIYGGKASGEIHRDTFMKVEEASTEEDAINYLKNNKVK